MVRILHVLGKLNMGGAESRVMDLYRHIDKSKVQFDFVIHTKEKCYFTDEILNMGGNIYSVPRFRIFNYFGYKKAWRELLDEHKGEFKAIQGHMTSTASIYLPIAKESGINTTIAHARSAGVDAGIKGYLTRFLRRNLSKKADILFTCSSIAGESVFGKKAVAEGRTQFIPNAIDVPLFKFDASIRDKMLKKYELEDKLIIGHVGRFHYAKNHEYLIKIFRDLLEDWDIEKIKPVLMLIGEGHKRNEIKALVIEYGIANSVIFVDNQKNIYDYYQMMDYFLYPSRYEGLPGTVIEAQASGLRVLMSDTICDEVKITDLVKTKSITDFSDDWAQIILDDVKNNHCTTVNRENYNDMVIKEGFDINNQSRKMEEFYINL